MPAKKHLDIRGIGWPISILNCKNEVDQMGDGDRMDILANDVDVIDNLLTLLKIAGHQVKKQKKNEYYQLTVIKGRFKN